MSADYYGTLGILPNAPEDVVKAVYRALAKKHHPDAGGDPDRFRAIAEAYEVLSDPIRRRDYDRLHETSYVPENDIGESDESLEQEWNTAILNAPEIDLLYWELKRSSNSLALNFRVNLLKSKMYHSAIQLFTDLERTFFTTYFGESEKIHKFVKFLLIEGHRGAARDLNQAVKHFGRSLNADAIIRKICADYQLLYYGFNEATHEEEKF